MEGNSGGARSQLSCSECRRRKAKCDRDKPCSNCSKHGRVCTYEKLHRTPLTRKYVSDIEKELERARSLLARPGTASDEGTSSSVGPGENGHGATMDASYLSVHDRSSLPAESMTVTLQEADYQMQPATSIPQPTSGLTPGINDASASSGPAAAGIFSLETPPRGVDFHWDERREARSDDHVPDGMAGLGGRHSRGYMGVASGAAFLRLADLTPEDATQGEEEDEGSDDLEVSIPTSPTSITHLEPFVDAYFQTYHVSYPIVHESSFRAQFMEIIPRPRSRAWEVLAFTISAIGAFASSETVPVADQALFHAAKARLSVDMLETGNLMLVQALTLISNYVQKRNKPNSGYNYMGLAKRMAMGIGLHKEFPAWRTKPLALEIRRRVWWCLFNFDVGAIITFSRPLDMPKEGIEVQLPSNVSDMSVTPSTTVLPPDTQTTTLYTHLRCQAKFHLATSEVYARMIATPYPSAEEMVSIDDLVLAKFKNDLPDFYHEHAQQPGRYSFPHAVFHWRLHNFRVLVFRAFVLRSLFSANGADPMRGLSTSSQAEHKAVQRCFDSAEHTIRSISSFWQNCRHNVLTCWYSLYFLFQAVMIPVASLRNCPDSNRAFSWKDQIRLALNTMEQMSTLNPTAVRCQTALHNLCGRHLGQDYVGAGAFDLGSPHTQLQLMQSLTWPMADIFDTIPFDMSWYEYGGGDAFNKLPGLS